MRDRAAILGVLRQADWLTKERAQGYCWMLAAVTTIQAVHLVVLTVSTALADPHWRPLPNDFNAFWSAAMLTIEGRSATIYDPAIMHAAQAVGAQPAPGAFLPYMNPPIFVLLCAPLGLLPYLPALAAFVVSSYAAMVVFVRRILPPVWPLLPIIALPVAMFNGTEGQNGSITAAIYAAGMLLLDRRPVLAGLCLGLLSFKPHLACGIPVALGAARRWTALAGFAASICGLALLSWLVLGTATWTSFLNAAPVMRRVLEQGETWPKMQSVYAATRILHGPIPLAVTMQALAASLALAVLAQHAARRPGAGAEIAASVATSLLCTPYVLDYDLVCLAVPMAWLAARGTLSGWGPWEKSLLAALYFYPLEARNMNVRLGVPLAPLFIAALLGLLVSRCWKDTAPADISTRFLNQHAEAA